MAPQVLPSEAAPEASGPRQLSLKERIWIFVEDNTILNTFVLLVIVFSTVCFVLETETAFKGADMQFTWFAFEAFAVSIFSVEYIVRFTCCPKKWPFITSPLNAVDLLAILPFYITLGFSASIGVAPWDKDGMSGSEALSATTVFRAVRLFRVFRIFKLGRYSAGMQVFYGALAHSATSLSLLGFLLAICIILFSSVMYLVEGQGEYTTEFCEDPETLGFPYACEVSERPASSSTTHAHSVRARCGGRSLAPVRLSGAAAMAAVAAAPASPPASARSPPHSSTRCGRKHTRLRAQSPLALPTPSAGRRNAVAWHAAVLRLLRCSVCTLTHAHSPPHLACCLARFPSCAVPNNPHDLLVGDSDDDHGRLRRRGAFIAGGEAGGGRDDDLRHHRHRPPDLCPR